MKQTQFQKLLQIIKNINKRLTQQQDENPQEREKDRKKLQQLEQGLSLQKRDTEKHLMKWAKMV